MTTEPTFEDVVASVRSLLPAISERARDTEVNRSVPSETIDELRSAGAFKLYQPKRYGGYELAWGSQIELSRVVGAACGSTAWLIAVLSTHAGMVGRMDLQAQDDVWESDADALIATGSARIDGVAVPVEGGYLLGGVWRFASGVDHSQWTMVAAPVEGQEAAGVSGVRQFLIPEAEYEIIDDWHVAGLRGTGSKQIVIDPPLFVPGHRTIGFLEMLGANPPGASVNDGYVHRMELGPYFGTILLGPVLGIAEGALDQYLETTRSKVGVVRRNRIAESEPVQLRVAESAAEIHAARVIIDKMVDLLDRRGATDTGLTSRERVETMRDRAFATRICVNAVHRLVRQMGATGLADDNPVQRHFRDISAAQGQIGLNWDRNGGTYGKWLLGVETGEAAIDGKPSSSRDAEAGIVG
jgi:alkylation response protein AidB-like acyl-CoA dehydrogenase